MGELKLERKFAAQLQSEGWSHDVIRPKVVEATLTDSAIEPGPAVIGIDTELGVVEGVEGLQAELELGSLGDIHVLNHSHVLVGDPWFVQYVASAITEDSTLQCCESGCVEQFL